MLSPAAAAYQPGTRIAASAPDGITVLGVQFASIGHLFAPLADRTGLMLVHVNDWLNELRSKFRPGAFVPVQPLEGADWQEWRLPPGWTNRWAQLVMPRLADRIERAWRERGWSNPRLVVAFPYFLPLLQALGPERAIYYAVDNYQAYWPRRAATLCVQENELIQSAAATVAASSALADWFRDRVPSAADRIHHLPNGVHPDMITAVDVAKHGPRPLEENLARSFGKAKGAVVGCYGNIGSGDGVKFFAAIVERLPDFRFLLMGQVLSPDATARLSRCPNVVMTGHLQEPDSLRFLRQCGVMIIPMPLDGHGRYASPNRLWIYMATGRPIVSTPIPEVTKFGELVYAAANVDEFVDALRRAAAETDTQRVARRIAIAQQHTWPVLAQRMWSILAFGDA